MSDNKIPRWTIIVKMNQRMYRQRMYLMLTHSGDFTWAVPPISELAI